MTDFLSSEEVGKRLGVSARRVQELAKMGRIPYVRHGRSIRIPCLAWEAFVAGQTAAAMAALNHEGSTHAKPV